MSSKKDNPGVFVPPPLIYVATFFISILLKRLIPINTELVNIAGIHYVGIGLIVANFALTLPALTQFFRTKNTVVTIKPANSLQVSGIYSITRNPMYLGLLILYLGIATIKGNPWTYLLVPILVVVITNLVIKPEEKYLERAFGQSYLDYKKKVRRWI